MVESNYVDRLVLGCAQLGIEGYGAANTVGRVTYDDAVKIVDAAWDSGVRMFDTADAYGNSESMLGECLEDIDARDPLVITKVSAPPDDLVRCVEMATKRLRVKKLYALLLHKESLMERVEEYALEVGLLKERGLVERFGASFYDCAAAQRCLQSPHVDIVQVPYSLFNDDAYLAGVFETANKLGKQVMVRSVYVQGRLLLPPFDSMRWPVVFGDTTLGESVNVDVDTKTVALTYALRTSHSSLVVVGAETPRQVLDNVHIAEAADLITLRATVEQGMHVPACLSDPRVWRKR